MKIILLKDVKKIGKKYEIKEVANGYALNKLIPEKMAIPATSGNIKMIEVKKKGDLLETAKTEAEIQKALNEIKGISIEIKGKVNEKGHLFAGVHKEQIAEQIKKQKGLNLNPGIIILDTPLKEAGEHTINLKVGERTATFKVTIKGE